LYINTDLIEFKNANLSTNKLPHAIGVWFCSSLLFAVPLAIVLAVFHTVLQKSYGFFEKDSNVFEYLRFQGVMLKLALIICAWVFVSKY
jgi:hypothetical protein